MGCSFCKESKFQELEHITEVQFRSEISDKNIVFEVKCRFNEKNQDYLKITQETISKDVIQLHEQIINKKKDFTYYQEFKLGTVVEDQDGILIKSFQEVSMNGSDQQVDQLFAQLDQEQIFEWGDQRLGTIKEEYEYESKISIQQINKMKIVRINGKSYSLTSANQQKQPEYMNKIKSDKLIIPTSNEKRQRPQ